MQVEPYVPGGQAAHIPFKGVDPDGQYTHCADAIGDVAPLLHGIQLDAAANEYSPVLHSIHVVEFNDDENVPGEQGEQLDDLSYFE